jgi:uncharacterized protein YfiM (DUF2279 family)
MKMKCSAKSGTFAYIDAAGSPVPFAYIDAAGNQVPSHSEMRPGVLNDEFEQGV